MALGRIIITTPHDAAETYVGRQGKDLYPICHFDGLYYDGARHKNRPEYDADVARLVDIVQEEGSEVVVFGASDAILTFGLIDAARFLVWNTPAKAAIVVTAREAYGVPDLFTVNSSIIMQDGMGPLKEVDLLKQYFWQTLIDDARKTREKIRDLPKVA